MMKTNAEASNETIKPARYIKPGGDLQPATSTELEWDDEHRK